MSGVSSLHEDLWLVSIRSLNSI